MIQVLHISAECYPAAKTGGLGDVVGSLPKYMTRAGVLSAAILPKYYLKWIMGRDWVTVYSGSLWNNWREWRFSVQQEKGNTQGYPMFVVDIPGLYDRPGIYNDPSGAPYGDEVLRYIVFQQAVLEWLLTFPWHDRPRVLHCHDHHSGLIPWMVKYCPNYHPLAPIPTVFTIHNGQYQGMFSWQNGALLPPYEANAKGLVDWNSVANPMAAAVKTAWAVTTVSQSYLYELHDNSLGLEVLFRQEWAKQYGIINGIDAQIWDPATDPMIQHRLNTEYPDRRAAIRSFKERNKKVLCEWFGFPYDAPLVSFIGRMVGEKGVDVLPDVYKRFIHGGGKVSFLVLGTGEAWTQNQFRAMAHQYPGRFNAVIDYNEALSHQIYAGSDFLIMPSRVEPCGLNQLYAMRYGTIPIVRAVGGLKDTVPDIGEADGSGRGFRFEQFSVEDAYHAIYRAASMYHRNPDITDVIRERIMALDFSWENTVEKYFNVYRRIGAYIEPAFSVTEVEEPQQSTSPAAAEPDGPSEIWAETAVATTTVSDQIPSAKSKTKRGEGMKPVKSPLAEKKSRKKK
jgi:starch synthase